MKISSKILTDSDIDFSRSSQTKADAVPAAGDVHLQVLPLIL